MAEHTPGPWIRCGYLIDSDCGRVGKHVVERICTVDTGPTHEESEANAEFIVRACNAHHDLLEACEDMMLFWNDLDERYPDLDTDGISGFNGNSDYVGRARAAIAKAKGE